MVSIGLRLALKSLLERTDAPDVRFSVKLLQRSCQRVPGNPDLVGGFALNETRLLTGGEPMRGAQGFVARHLTGLVPTIIAVSEKDMAASEAGGVLDDETIVPFCDPPSARQPEGAVLTHLQPDPCVARLSLNNACQTIICVEGSSGAIPNVRINRRQGS